MLFAHSKSQKQSDPNSIKFLSNSTNMNQSSSLRNQSPRQTSHRVFLRVSFNTNSPLNTLRRSHSISNLSTPLTDSPQFFSFEKLAGKIFNKRIIESLTCKDAVLTEVRILSSAMMRIASNS